MKLNRSMVAILASASLLVLTGCGNSGDTTAEVEPSATGTESPVADTSEPAAGTKESFANKLPVLGQPKL